MCGVVEGLSIWENIPPSSLVSRSLHMHQKRQRDDDNDGYQRTKKRLLDGMKRLSIDMPKDDNELMDVDDTKYTIFVRSLDDYDTSSEDEEESIFSINPIARREIKQIPRAVLKAGMPTDPSPSMALTPYIPPLLKLPSGDPGIPDDTDPSKSDDTDPSKPDFDNPETPQSDAMSIDMSIDAPTDTPID
ncbi:hypothetical protein CANCADRAFT_43376 [Tortispora caseinolytica NRRL Y-17796]|uniref:Uncharacterized protein n=1 Tax=Tortispora caseinolytica NRRL Y-17796 TaxID=767744 RepID=A0A1E4TM27_9ASCO|nr:hypothetical protein CANCADRAFT_43376 [Tortispora caseinolytica NRRL Y-17796]